MTGDGRVTQRDLYDALRDFRQESKDDRREILDKLERMDERLQVLEDWRIVDKARKADVVGLLKTGPGVVISLVALINMLATAVIWISLNTHLG